MKTEPQKYVRCLHAREAQNAVLSRAGLPLRILPEYLDKSDRQ